MKITDDSRLFLGIDGGGSTCRARLRDDKGQLLGEGFAGPANLRLGLAQVEKEILTCTSKALQQAGVPDYPLKDLHVGMGLAGAVLSEDQQVTQTLKARFASCQLESDAYTACLGAHLGEEGGIVIVGTGSCAHFINAHTSRTLGGWGLALSDQASGAWLGREALSYSLQALEGLRPSSPLCDALNAEFAHQPGEMLRWSETAKPADYAQFAPRVFEYAAADDSLACQLIDEGCGQLSLLIEAILSHGITRICLLGGLAQGYSRYLPEPMRSTLCSARTDALDGALLMAGLSKQALQKSMEI